MKGMAIVGAIIAIVGAIIGFTIVNDISADVTNPDTVTDSFTAAAYATGNQLTYPDMVANSEIVTNTTHTLTKVTHYNISYVTGIINISGTYTNDPMLVTYNYYDREYFNNTLSRTITDYIVPIGLLGVMGLAIFVAGR